MQITTPNGHVLKLYENDVVTVDLFSSLFTTDGELKGSYSYSVKAPLLPNKHVIGYSDILEKNTSGQIDRCNVRLGNIYWTDVNLKYKVTDQKEIEFTLTLNLSFINSKIKNTKLPQVPFPNFDLGGTVNEVEANMKIASEGNFDQYPFVFAPVSNMQFTGEIDDDISDGIIAPPVERELAVNTFRVESGNVIFNAPNRTYPMEGQDLPAFKHHAVPFFTLTYVLEHIIKWLGFVPDGPVFFDPIIKKLLIYNINASYISTKGLSWIPIGQQTNMYISASSHLPNISIADFFKILASYPGIYPLIRTTNNTLSFYFKRDIHRFPILDWQKKQVNLEEIDPLLYGGYRLTIKDSDSVDLWTEGEFQDEIKVGAAENELAIDVALLGEDNYYMTNASFLIPMDNQEGNIFDPAFRRLSNFTSPKDQKDFLLSFLFYNGYVANGTGIQYPKVSAMYTDGTSLRIAGEKGVYNTFLKNYMERVEGTKAVKVDYILNHLDLVNWRDDSIVIMRSKTGASIHGLIKKLSCDVKNGSPLVHAKAEGILLDSTFFKQLPEDMPFLRFAFFNQHRENISLTEFKDFTDIKFELFRDRECTLPYMPQTPIVFEATIITKQLIYSETPRVRPTPDVFSEGFRVVLAEQETTLFDFLIRHSRRSSPQILLNRKFRVYDTSYFYVLT